MLSVRKRHIVVEELAMDVDHSTSLIQWSFAQPFALRDRKRASCIKHWLAEFETKDISSDVWNFAKFYRRTS